MKKIIFSLLAVFCFSFNTFAESLGVFINDNKGKVTNIRNAPKGKIVHSFALPAANGIMITVDYQVNGWWHIEFNEYWEPDKDMQHFVGSNNGYWVHYSVIAVSTRNYGNQRLYLRNKPSNSGQVVYSFNTEMLLRPVDIKGEWVKVQTYDGKHSGWLELEWICGNSLTNCN